MVRHLSGVSGRLKFAVYKSSQPLIRPTILRLFLAVALLPCSGGGRLWGEQTATKPIEKLSFRPADPLNASAFDHFYDMDYDSSIQECTVVQKRHPDDPTSVNHL